MEVIYALIIVVLLLLLWVYHEWSAVDAAMAILEILCTRFIGGILSEEDYKNQRQSVLDNMTWLQRKIFNYKRR